MSKVMEPNMQSSSGKNPQPDTGDIDQAQAVKTLRQIIESRRSVRRFLDEPIDDGVLRDCLQLAMLAPNSSNLQPWDFYLIKNPNKKQQMVRACLNQNAAKTSQALIAVVARSNTYRANSRKILQQWPTKPVPAIVKRYYAVAMPFNYFHGPLNLFGALKFLVVTLIGFFRPVTRGPYSAAGTRLWAVKSTALAAENLMLALRAHGYDSCPMEGFDSKRVDKILNLPQDASVVMIIGAGKRAPNGIYHQRMRFDPEQSIHIV